MEHYKSRNNDFFHFTNPHDDVSELEDDDYDELQYYDVDDDRSCDFSFHTYRPLQIHQSQSPSANFQTSGVMNENDIVTTSVEEFGTLDNGALILQLDDTMKNICGKLQHTIEGISTQVSRIEERTCTIDKCVENVKNSEERYHGTTHRKLRQMQSILQEVQDGVLYLRDKHEIAETQLQLAKLKVSNKITTNQTNPKQQQQPQQSLPASQSSHQIPFTSFINQPPPSNNVTLPQSVSYHPAVPQTPYGLPQLTHVKSSRNYKSEFHAKYMPEHASFPDTHTRDISPSSYEISNIKPVEFYTPPHPQEESSRCNYTHTPVTQTLPHALPTAIELEDGSRSVENSNAVSVDDIVNKVTAMGFRRDLVRACVRNLTVNGSPVDLNAVLDSMMKNK